MAKMAAGMKSTCGMLGTRCAACTSGDGINLGKLARQNFKSVATSAGSTTKAVAGLFLFVRMALIAFLSVPVLAFLAPWVGPSCVAFVMSVSCFWFAREPAAFACGLRTDEFKGLCSASVESSSSYL